ncbi:tRNA (5-methylaminomethyl-2-thiouridine)(34)-methyltransferase MnmD [Phormidesmis sp. 146-12]
MPFTPQPTGDGSFTFFSTEYGEAFHSKFGARQEAELKFVEPTLLRQKASRFELSARGRASLNLLDICYGLGYNTAAALEAIWQVNPDCRVRVVALEIDATVPQEACCFAETARVAHQLLTPWHPEIQTLLTTLAKSGKVKTDRLDAQLVLGDARQTLPLESEPFDAIFLDPFSPPHCPQLWSIEFLSQVARLLKSEGRLATYSCAAAVRTALMATGLRVGATDPVGRRSPGTIASWEAADLPQLSPQELEHLQTRAAVPYRDFTLKDSPAVILKRREIEQASSGLEPTSHWKKRWQGRES